MPGSQSVSAVDPARTYYTIVRLTQRLVACGKFEETTEGC